MRAVRRKARRSNGLERLIDASLPGGSLSFAGRFGKAPDVSREALARKFFGWVYACASVTASRFASVPLRLYAARGRGQSGVKNYRCRPVSETDFLWLQSKPSLKGLDQVANAEEFEEITEHPLLSLLRSVNDQENGFEMRELTCVMLDLTGDAYWFLEKDALGVPTRLFVLRSQWVKILPDRQKFVSGYVYGPQSVLNRGDVLTLPPEDVIHFKYPNPLDPWYGMGPVQASAYAIESQEVREKFVLATMGNMARPDLIVKYLEGELDPKERAAVEREWNALFKGAKNAGKVKVTDFRYEVDKIGWSPSELDFNRGEDWILKKIASNFPVPLGLIDSSQISRAPRSGMEGSDLYMAQFNTLPRCVRFEEKLNECLTPMYDERLFLAFDNPVPKDKVFQNSEEIQRLNTYQITINEVRKLRGEEPVPWGEVPFVGAGIAPLGSSPLGSVPIVPKEETPTETASKPSSSDKDSTLPNEGLERILSKAAGEGVTMEVEGAYVHPTLAGVPIRLRVRNERGRFDRRSPDKFRTSREVLETLRLKEG